MMEDKIEQLAASIINFSRSQLMVNLRFMDMAISGLKIRPTKSIDSICVNGDTIYYSPRFILKIYKQCQTFPARKYLHTLLHCVLRHFFVNHLVDHRVWNIACDLAVENILLELELDCTELDGDSKRRKELQILKTKIKYFNAEHIYRYLLDNNENLDAFEPLFCQDNHDIWYNPDIITDKDQYTAGSMVQTQTMKQLEKLWRDISEKIELDLESFSRQRGKKSGSLIQNLRAVNRERYDYTSFLKKFSVYGETMKINDDEFDYIFYTYGLQLYERMPLVEPLEYKDVKRIKEFVIAIDTSCSVKGETVQKFVQKTYNILKQEENFFTKINLHIIQCDADIQEHVKITTQEEFDAYLKDMKIRGLGGTDYRPVFQLVDQLIEEKEFTNLKGMIYFTDGCGKFPSRQPSYQTAIVFIDDEYNDYNVPVWAIKLILRKEEI